MTLDLLVAESPHEREARVLCDACSFAWYGATAAHGLSIIGHCPRCGGSLRFLAAAEPPSEPAMLHGDPGRTGVKREVVPAQVMGTPRGWDR